MQPKAQADNTANMSFNVHIIGWSRYSRENWNGKLSGILISIHILLSIVGDTSFYTRVWLPESVRVGISLDSTFTVH